jgi:pimeloyl-ACP methyl ester carboxylesterase
MAVLDFGDPDRPVDLVFLHANGFNALTYRTVLEPLADRLRIWAPDLRGHGRSTLPAEAAGRRSWHDHRDDVEALLVRLDAPVRIAGHSMGGTSGLLAAAERPEAVKDLVLFDPVIWTRPMVLAFHLPGLRGAVRSFPIVKSALRRRRMFESREAALASYRGRGAFRGWSDAMLADYLADGLVDDDAGLTLAAAPEWEASNYAAQGHDPWRAMRRYGGPIRILKAEVESICRVPERPVGLPRVRVETVAGGHHLFPMVMPDLVRDALLAPAPGSR